jgi:hypothetical protein
LIKFVISFSIISEEQMFSLSNTAKDFPVKAIGIIPTQLNISGFWISDIQGTTFQLLVKMPTGKTESLKSRIFRQDLPQFHFSFLLEFELIRPDFFFPFR